MTQCAFCNYRDAALLEQQIATKQLTQVQAATIIGCNKSTISRHMGKCVPKKVAEWVKPEAAKEETLNVVNALLESRERILSIYDDARQTGDMRAAIQALQCEVSQLSLMGKLSGQFSDGAQVNILMNPEFVKLKQMLIKTLEPYPEARVRLSERLMEMNEGDGNKS